MSTKLDSELVALFGRWTLATAQVRQLEELNIDPGVLKAAAEQIIEQRGSVERQRAIVDALDDDTAVALCIWFRDPGNAAHLVTQSKVKPRSKG